MARSTIRRADRREASGAEVMINSYSSALLSVRPVGNTCTLLWPDESGDEGKRDLLLVDPVEILIMFGGEVKRDLSPTRYLPTITLTKSNRSTNAKDSQPSW